LEKCRRFDDALIKDQDDQQRSTDILFHSQPLRVAAHFDRHPRFNFIAIRN
jgi:hypothetical protein